MNAAVIRKTFNESLLILVIVTLGVGFFEAVLLGVLSSFTADFQEFWLQQQFIQTLVSAIAGAPLGDNITATGFMTIGFAHPLIYAMVWTFLLTHCTRMPTGEIDRGTAEWLLTLPISRKSIYTSVTFVWVLSGVPICASMLLGAWVGDRLTTLPQPLDFSPLFKLSANFFALFFCVGCGASCLSAFGSRRGVMIGWLLAWLFGSFLLNFLATMWEPIRYVDWLDIYHYYRPLPIVRSGGWPIENFLVLFISGLVLWLIGLWGFSRRDIPAR